MHQRLNFEIFFKKRLTGEKGKCIIKKLKQKRPLLTCRGFRILRHGSEIYNLLIIGLVSVGALCSPLFFSGKISIIFMEVTIIATNNSNEQLINERIRDKQVFLIDADGEKRGVVDTAVALRMAEEKDLDLVLIAAQNPPVCRIMDYSKYRFEKAKREKEQRKNQRIVELKEVRLSPTIDMHDLEVKAKSCIKFLSSGNKVKVTIRFRGRQVTHNDLGHDVFNAFLELVRDYAQVDKAAKMEGRNLIMILMPKAQK